MPHLNTDTSTPDISIVLPIYNEEACIDGVIDELCSVLDTKLGRPYEVLAVDDGSTDHTPERLRAQAARRNNFRVLRLTPTAGQSTAFCAGFRAARGRIVVTLDADGQNDSADIPAVVAQISDTVDCCCGYRVRRMDTASKRWGSRLANAVRNRALGEQIIDTGCSVKAFKVEFVRTLQPWDGLHRFFASFVAMQGGRIVQIPVNHRPRSAGTSKYTNWRRLQKTVRDLRGVIWLKSRTRRCEVTEETRG